MKSSWFSLAGIISISILLVACGAAQTQEPAPPPPPPPPLPASGPLPDAELSAASEFDIAPINQGPVVPKERRIDPSLLPPPRAAIVGPAPESGETIAAADDSIIYDKAQQYEEEMARVPAPPEPPPPLPPSYEIVYFDFDRSNIKPEFQAAIMHNADILKSDPSISVLIEGHCDDRGTTEYNLALGERRAVTVRDALISMGVDANQLQTVSYGEERPVALGNNEEAWALNRRAAITAK